MNNNENIINVAVRLLHPMAELPHYSTAGAAAADLSACIDEPYILQPGEIRLFAAGIAIAPESSGVVALVFGRSGLGTKHGITLANSVGVIDSDYRGEIKVALINRGASPYTVNPGERIAQLMFVPVCSAAFVQAETLNETGRGAGGFGSTGR